MQHFANSEDRARMLARKQLYFAVAKKKTREQEIGWRRVGGYWYGTLPNGQQYPERFTSNPSGS